MRIRLAITYLLFQGSNNPTECGGNISKVCNATSNKKGSLTAIRVCSCTLQHSQEHNFFKLCSDEATSYDQLVKLKPQEKRGKKTSLELYINYYSCILQYFLLIWSSTILSIVAKL